MDITTGDIEFMGDIVGGTIVMGPAESEPLLGVTALESVGIEVDPRNQTLRRLPSVRLKGSAAAGSVSATRLLVLSVIACLVASCCYTDSTADIAPSLCTGHRFQ